jgi:hypothetical protein
MENSKVNSQHLPEIQNNGDVKEEFCGACAALPLAFIGAGTAGIGAKGNHSKTKTIMLWGGIGLTLLSLGITIFFIARCKNCR